MGLLFMKGYLWTERKKKQSLPKSSLISEEFSALAFLDDVGGGQTAANRANKRPVIYKSGQIHLIGYFLLISLTKSTILSVRKRMLAHRFTILFLVFV